MTTTTKIFVILVCIFTFVFVPLAVSFSARTANWRQLAEDYRSELEIAYANERSVMAVAVAEAERYKALRDAEHERFLNLQQRHAELDEKVTALTQERNQLQRSEDNWEASARLLTAEMALKSKHNQALQDAREQALARERELRTRNLQLNDRVKELSAELVIRSQQLKQKVEEIAAYRNENQELRQQLGLGTAGAGQMLTSTPTPSAEAATPAAVSPIYASVTEVDGAMATIDVGSASGIRDGMRLVVLRDGSYVCDLKITNQITPTEAVGQILLERDKRIRPGDHVEDAASFSSR